VYIHSQSNIKLTFGIGYPNDPGNKKNIYTYLSEDKTVTSTMQPTIRDFNILQNDQSVFLLTVPVDDA
jgi:hypothetical protein